MQDFRALSDHQLPPYNLDEATAIIHFWAAMAEVKLVTDICTLHFGILSRLAKVLLVLPHSNADPESLFSMIRKISTEQRLQLDPSTVSDLLSVKINNDHPCYDNKSLTTYFQVPKVLHEECYIKEMDNVKACPH